MDDSVSSDDEGLQRKALAVELPEDFDPKSEPFTGEEYLHHVIYERTQHPACVTAPTKPESTPGLKEFLLKFKDEVPKLNEDLLPTKEWQDLKLKEFTNLKQFVGEQLPKNVPTKSFREKEFIARMTTEYPKFSEMASYSDTSKIRMLEAITNYLETEMINENIGIWLYASLLTLDAPLSREFSFRVRNLAKQCAVVRSKVTNAEEVVPYNLIILIVSKFYGQLDLADPY